jgi:hypothetical protein
MYRNRERESSELLKNHTRSLSNIRDYETCVYSNKVNTHSFQFAIDNIQRDIEICFAAKSSEFYSLIDFLLLRIKTTYWKERNTFWKWAQSKQSVDKPLPSQLENIWRYEHASERKETRRLARAYVSFLFFFSDFGIGRGCLFLDVN